MNKKGKKIKKKKLKLRKSVIITLLVIIVTTILIYNYFNNLKIKNIYITGTETIKDIDIIEAAGIKDYPVLYKLNIKKIKESINNLPKVDNVSIKRNIFGKLTINIKESKILFFYKYNNKYITSSGESIDANDEYYGYPTLINFTPDTILDSLIIGFNKIDYSTILLINEIEYNPYKTSDGTVIDDKRFTLKMNDTNTVIIDTVNIRNLNMYPTIYTSLGLDKTKGVLYLDTIAKDTVNFRSYAAIKAEAEKQKEEKEPKKEDE